MRSLTTTTSVCIAILAAAPITPVYSNPPDFSYQRGYYVGTMQCGKITDGGRYAGYVVVSRETSADNPLRIKFEVTPNGNSDSSLDALQRYTAGIIGCGKRIYIVDFSGLAKVRVKTGQRLTPADYPGMHLFGATVDSCFSPKRETPVLDTQRNLSDVVILYNHQVNRPQVKAYFAGNLDLKGLEAACATVHEKAEIIRLKGGKAIDTLIRERDRVKKDIEDESKRLEDKTGDVGKLKSLWDRIKSKF